MNSLIVLSAGLSTRFGSPKALAKLGRTNVIGHLLNSAVMSEIDEVIVVLGAFAPKIRPSILKHKKVRTVYNKNYRSGQTSSFKAGLAALSPSVRSFGLLPVDTPLVKPATINALIREFQASQAAILIPRFDSQKGHPPFFSRSLKRKFLSLSDAIGINSVLPKYAGQTVFCDVQDPGVIQSFNTPRDLAQLKKSLII